MKQYVTYKTTNEERIYFNDHLGRRKIGSRYMSWSWPREGDLNRRIGQCTKPLLSKVRNGREDEVTIWAALAMSFPGCVITRGRSNCNVRGLA